MFQQAEKVSEEAEDVQRQQFLALKSPKKKQYKHVISYS